MLCRISNLLVSAVFSLLFINIGMAVGDTLKLRADSWMPFNGEPNSERPGYAVEITREILKEDGHSLDYQVLPWSRSIIEAKRCEIDGVIGATREEVPEFLFPDEEISQSRDGFYTLATSNWTFNGIDSLKSIKLGVINDYSYGKTLDEYLQSNPSKNHLEKTGGDDAESRNIQKLKKGRLDAIAATREVFWAAVDELKLDRSLFREAGLLPEIDPLYIAFAPQCPGSSKWAARWNTGMRELRSNGRLVEILERYGLKDWK